MASTAIRDAWADLWGVVCFCLFIAALGFAAGFHFHFGPKMAAQTWREAVAAYPWLAAAGEPADRGWFKLLLTPKAEIAQRYAPQAIAGLVAQPIRIAPDDGMAAAQRQIDQVNSFKPACAAALLPGAIPACATPAFEARFAAVKREFRTSAAARDYYLRFGDRAIYVLPLTLFQTRLCNAGAAYISVTASPLYHPDDERAGTPQRTSIAPGQCGLAFWAKLQKAPHVDIRAEASGAAASQLGRIPGYSDIWGGQPARWTVTSTFENATLEGYEFSDPGLCFGRETPVCGGVVIDDRAVYAAKFAASLEGERLQPHLILAKFIIGVTARNPSRRDEIGPILIGVEPGSPAAVLGLAPGDRILEVNGESVFTIVELQRKIEASGRLSGYQAPIRFTVLSGGQIKEGSVAPTFSKAYFDQFGYRWKSVFIAVVDMATLGNLDRIDCGIFRRFRRDGLTYDQCIARWTELRAAMDILYARQRFFGAFLGGIVSPLRVLGRLAGLVVAETFATTVAVEVAEAAILEGSSRGPPRTGGQYLKDTLTSAALPVAGSQLFVRRMP